MKAIALPLTLLLAGCFSPHFLEGAFACGPGGLCPDEQSCSPLDNHCYAHPPVAVIPDAGVPEASTPTPDAGDVCTPTRLAGQTCDVYYRNDPSRRCDTCVAHSKCVEGNLGDPYCLPDCTITGPGTDSCNQVFGPCAARNLDWMPPTTAVMVCGPPSTPCDPVNATGCPGTLACYVRGAQTYCELSSGQWPAKMACSVPSDCLPQNTCTSDGHCHRECAAGSMCPGTRDACVLASAAAPFGICP